jgi:hypothetical protein
MKVAADGKKKFTLLTEAPAAASRIPTVTELNAGIDISCAVLDSDANWSPPRRTGSTRSPPARRATPRRWARRTTTPP